MIHQTLFREQSDVSNECSLTLEDVGGGVDENSFEKSA